MILHRWISVGSDLKFDARRDLDDVGATCIEGISQCMQIQLLVVTYQVLWHLNLSVNIVG